MEKVKDFIKEFKVVIGMFAVAGGLMAYFGSGQATAEQALAAANEAKSVNKDQQTSLDMLTSMIKEHDGALTATMTMMGIDPENARKWSRMPKKPVLDTLGNPVLYTPWIVFEDNIHLALQYQFVKNDSGQVVEMLVDTLYDVREKK